MKRTKITTIQKIICGTLCSVIVAKLMMMPTLAKIKPVDETMPLAILSVNPGYTRSNTGEGIEIIKLSDSPTLSLAGLSVFYLYNGGKSEKELISFPGGSQLAGEGILLRYASSSDVSEGDITYTKTIAMDAGAIELRLGDRVIDSVCWGSYDTGCAKKFNSASPSYLVRDLETGEFQHQAGYTYSLNSSSSSVVFEDAGETSSGDAAGGNASNADQPTPSQNGETVAPKCAGLRFNEILSYYESEKSEQFIELFNSTDDDVDVSGCALRYKKKIYALAGVVEASGYLVRDTADFTLTKNPSSSNTIELLDTTGEVLDTLVYLHGQKKATSYALFGYGADGKGDWRTTYYPTPGMENVYQEYRSCPVGKVINPETGNCVKASTMTATISECPAGKYRNPLTGRCKKYDTDSGLKECAEGYERNPETNRCRKIKNNTGAEFALVPETGEERTTFIAMGAIIAVVLVGAIYAIFQFRFEIGRLIRKIFRRGRK